MAIVVTTVAIVQSFNFYRSFYISLLFFSGGFIWLPVVLSYIFSYTIKNKEYDVRTFQRCLIFLIASIVNIFLADLLLDSYSLGETILVYMIVYPFQVAMILIFDLLLFLTRKYGRQPQKAAS